MSFPIENETGKTDKNGEENSIIISYKIKFVETQDLWCRMQYQILSIIFLKEFIKFSVHMEMTMKNAKHNIIFVFQQELLKTFDENWKNRFVNTYKLCKYEINRFILLLPKGVYPFEYIDIDS